MMTAGDRSRCFPCDTFFLLDWWITRTLDAAAVLRGNAQDASFHCIDCSCERVLRPFKSERLQAQAIECQGRKNRVRNGARVFQSFSGNLAFTKRNKPDGVKRFQTWGARKRADGRWWVGASMIFRLWHFSKHFECDHFKFSLEEAVIHVRGSESLRAVAFILIHYS